MNMKTKSNVFYVVDYFVYDGKPVKWYYTTCGSWSDDKRRAKRFNKEIGTAIVNNINAYRGEKNKAELVND